MTKTQKRRARPIAEDSPREQPVVSDPKLDNAKRILAGAAASLLVGLGLSAIGDLTFGPYITVLALAAGVFGAHKLGRAGRDLGPLAATTPASHDE